MHRLQLTSEGRIYEISAPDAKTRNEWIAGQASGIKIGQIS